MKSDRVVNERLCLWRDTPEASMSPPSIADAGARLEPRGRLFVVQMDQVGSFISALRHCQDGGWVIVR